MGSLVRTKTRLCKKKNPPTQTIFVFNTIQKPNDIISLESELHVINVEVTLTFKINKNLSLCQYTNVLSVRACAI